MLFWAKHIFWPRPLRVVLHAKIDLWGPLWGVWEGSKSIFFVFFEHIFLVLPVDKNEHNLANIATAECGGLLTLRDLGVTMTAPCLT